MAARRRVLFGSGSGATIQGANLAHSGDVVVVGINHRLGVLGQTYLGEALGSDFAASGSVGVQDIVLALDWVRENIAHFGGDPNQVTIFGQSGGGRKVATLMAMPSAKGLFHRAIVESGAVLRLTTQEDAIRTTNLLLAELGLKARPGARAAAACLSRSWSPPTKRSTRNSPCASPA